MRGVGRRLLKYWNGGRGGCLTNTLSSGARFQKTPNSIAWKERCFACTVLAVEIPPKVLSDTSAHGPTNIKVGKRVSSPQHQRLLTASRFIMLFEWNLASRWHLNLH
jgi:hypothetical protein